MAKKSKPETETPKPTENEEEPKKEEKEEEPVEVSILNAEISLYSQLVSDVSLKTGEEIRKVIALKKKQLLELTEE